MSYRSEKPGDLWEDLFNCDGNCGAGIALWSKSKKIEPTVALAALGWLVISKDEAYCPACTKTAQRIAKVARQEKQ